MKLFRYVLLFFALGSNIYIYAAQNRNTDLGYNTGRMQNQINDVGKHQLAIDDKLDDFEKYTRDLAMQTESRLSKMEELGKSNKETLESINYTLRGILIAVAAMVVDRLFSIRKKAGKSEE